MSLETAINRLETANQELKRQIEKAKAYEPPEKIMEVFARQAADELTDPIRDMLKQNLRMSRLKNRTGDLADAVSHAEVSILFKKNRISIHVSFPTKARQSKANKTSVFVYSAALNYGAVRLPHISRLIRDLPSGTNKRGKAAVLGARAKKSLKKYALGGTLTKRQASSLQNGLKYRSHRKRAGVGLERKNDTAKSVVVGHAIIIKPRRFFYLNSAQISRVQEMFEASLQSKISEAAKTN